jgi:hypothetical protein
MGGSIPLMGMLTNQFPESQFIITGVLGPDTNAHGPNEVRKKTKLLNSKINLKKKKILVLIKLIYL